jgi:hypothetical protein
VDAHCELKAHALPLATDPACGKHAIVAAPESQSAQVSVAYEAAHASTVAFVAPVFGAVSTWAQLNWERASQVPTSP